MRCKTLQGEGKITNIITHALVQAEEHSTCCATETWLQAIHLDEVGAKREIKGL